MDEVVQGNIGKSGSCLQFQPERENCPQLVQENERWFFSQTSAEKKCGLAFLSKWR